MGLLPAGATHAENVCTHGAPAARLRGGRHIASVLFTGIPAPSQLRSPFWMEYSRKEVMQRASYTWSKNTFLFRDELLQIFRNISAKISLDSVKRVWWGAQPIK